MEIDDGLPVTEAQWMEHSYAWRLAHLHRAPSAYLRQQALAGQEPGTELAAHQRQASIWRSHLALEMMVVLAVVAAVVIGAALR